MRLKFIHASIAADNGQAPEKVMLFKEGWGKLDDGQDFLMDAEAAKLVIDAVSVRGNDVVFDYEHQTLTGDKAPAAGWIRGLAFEPGAGLVATMEWTSEASGYLANREYRYFSPVFAVRKSDFRVCDLYSVALTNTPLTRNLAPLVAKLNPQKEETDMEFLKKVAKALGLSEAADETAVLAAVDVAAKRPDPSSVIAAKDVLGALGLAQGGTSEVVAEIHVLKAAKEAKASEEVVRLAAKLAAIEADGAVFEAVKAGKIAPAQKEWAENYAKSDLAGFRLFVAKAPVVVPVQPLPSESSTPADATDPTVLAVAKMMGVSEEDLKIYGK